MALVINDAVVAVNRNIIRDIQALRILCAQATAE